MTSSTNCRVANAACDCRRCAVASRAWAERSALLAVARSRTTSESEAQDVVSEAIVRALECPDVDPHRVGGWLTTVVMRLCVDQARDRARAPKRRQFALMHHASEPSVEGQVLDRVAASGVRGLVRKLPADQRRVLVLRSEGHPVSGIARELDISAKAAESLLSRARASTRPLVSGLGVVAAACLVGLRRAARPRTLTSAGPAAVAASCLAVVLLPAFAPPQAPEAPRATTPSLQPADRRFPVNAQPDRVDLGAAEAPRPATAPQRPIRPLAPTVLGPVKVTDHGAHRTAQDESLPTSLKRCVEQGVVLSTQYIGCRSAKR